MLPRHKPFLLSTFPVVLVLVQMTRLQASIGVTHSYSSRPFLYTLDFTYNNLYVYVYIYTPLQKQMSAFIVVTLVVRQAEETWF